MVKKINFSLNEVFINKLLQSNTFKQITVNFRKTVSYLKTAWVKTKYPTLQITSINFTTLSRTLELFSVPLVKWQWARVQLSSEDRTDTWRLTLDKSFTDQKPKSIDSFHQLYFASHNILWTHNIKRKGKGGK